MNNIPLKRCSRGDKCVHPDGPMLPATKEYFRCDKKRKDGLCPQCKVCEADYRATRRQERHLYNTAYYAAHRDELAAYRAANRERQAIYRETNGEKYAATAKVYRANHYKERSIYQANYIASRAQEMKAQRQTPQYKLVNKLRSHHRRARKHGLPMIFTADDWQRCLNYWRGRCAYCGRQANNLFTPAHQEHFIPLVSPDCPGTVPWNMLPACGSCNHSKRDKSPTEWLTQKFGQRRAAEILARIEVYFEWVRQQN